MTMEPGTLEFPLYRYAGPAQNNLVIDFVGYDFSSSNFEAQFRKYPDQQGAPLINLKNAAANAEGISVSVSTQTIADEDGNDIYDATVSTVTIRINETTVENTLPPSQGVSQNGKYEMAWDLLIDKVRWIKGGAVIYAGVSQ